MAYGDEVRKTREELLREHQHPWQRIFTDYGRHTSPTPTGEYPTERFTTPAPERPPNTMPQTLAERTGTLPHTGATDLAPVHEFPQTVPEYSFPVAAPVPAEQTDWTRLFLENFNKERPSPEQAMDDALKQIQKAIYAPGMGMATPEGTATVYNFGTIEPVRTYDRATGTDITPLAAQLRSREIQEGTVYQREDQRTTEEGESYYEQRRRGGGLGLPGEMGVEGEGPQLRSRETSKQVASAERRESRRAERLGASLAGQVVTQLMNAAQGFYQSGLREQANMAGAVAGIIQQEVAGSLDVDKAQIDALKKILPGQAKLLASDRQIGDLLASHLPPNKEKFDPFVFSQDLYALETSIRQARDRTLGLAPAESNTYPPDVVAKAQRIQADRKRTLKQDEEARIKLGRIKGSEDRYGIWTIDNKFIQEIK